MRKALKNVLFIMSAMLIALLAFVIYLYMALPDKYFISKGGTVRLSALLDAVPCTNDNSQECLLSKNNNTERAELKLLGVIPIKLVDILSVDAPLLVPCGEPFGIKLLTDGVIVVEVSGFETKNGFSSPAQSCGLKTGDIIKSIDGKRFLQIRMFKGS